MYNFLSKTAWTMEEIPAYGLVHLSYLIIGVLISCFIAYKARNIERKKLNNILLAIGIFLVATEIYKQLFYTYYICEGSYAYWVFPFQLCSIPMYLCVILPFIKNDKLYTAFAAFLVSYNLLGGFISFFEPSGLIDEYVIITIHSFLWHMILVFIGLLLLLNKKVNLKLEHFKYAIVIFLILCIIAFGINLLFFKASDGGINMFFIGPAISSLIVFKQIATALGWLPNAIIYIIAVTLGALIIFALLLKLKTKLYKEEIWN